MTEQAEQVDVVVLGMGPGGEEVAGRLAGAGLETVGVEGKLLGGECPYWGCVPSKMMIRAANLLAETRRVPGMAGTSTVTPDWAPVARRIRDEATDDWNDQVAVDRFVGKGGHFVRGWGRLDGPRRVVVGDSAYEARRAVVVAAGAKPWAPPIPGLAELRGRYWTNRDAIEADTLPASLAVLGGGAIGVELGQVFARFGTDVTIVEAADRLLAVEEPESSALVAEVLVKEGLHLRISARITRRAPRGGQLRSRTGRRAARHRAAPPGVHGTAPRPGLAQRGQHRRRRQGAGHSRRRAPAASPTACGPWGTSPGWGPSPTSRCTRPASPWPTSSDRTTPPPTTGRCRT